MWGDCTLWLLAAVGAPRRCGCVRADLRSTGFEAEAEQRAQAARAGAQAARARSTAAQARSAEARNALFKESLRRDKTY